MSKSDFIPEVRRAAFLNIFVASLLFTLKLIAYRYTDSQALFSEAMESIVNILTAFIAFYVVYHAAKPADKDHPYGHGKMEFLSAGLEGGLIAFAAFLIIIEASQALYEKRPVQSLDFGLSLLAATGLINLVVGFYLKKLGHDKKSAALEASGRHLVADFWTSAGVFLGLFLVYLTEFWWLDAVIAMGVSLHLIREGYGLIRKSLAGLLDEEQEDVTRQIQQVVNNHHHEGIIQVHHVRVIHAGNYHHIDAHVVVPEFWTVEEAHGQSLAYEKKIIKDYGFRGEFHFHIDPCRRLYCRFCDLKECPVRKEPFQAYRQMTLTELTDPDEPREVTQKPHK